MATVHVDGTSHLSADSQPNSVGLVCGLAATRRSVCIHQMNHGHDDSTINIVVDYYDYYYYYLLSLNAEVQKRQKLGFFAARGRQNKAIETIFGT